MINNCTQVGVLGTEVYLLFIPSLCLQSLIFCFSNAMQAILSKICPKTPGCTKQVGQNYHFMKGRFSIIVLLTFCYNFEFLS